MDLRTRLAYIGTGFGNFATGLGMKRLSLTGEPLKFVNGLKHVEVDTTTTQGQYEALTKCSVVQACVVLRADAFLNLKIWAKDYDGRKIKLNNYIRQDLKALNTLNPYQDFQVFNNMVESKAATYGRCYIQKVKLLGLDKFEYYPIPNEMIKPIYMGLRQSNELFESEPTYYEVTLYDGKTLRLEKDEVVVLKDNMLFGNIGDGNVGYGTSRLIGLQEQISTLLSAGEVLTQTYADGGGRGIIGQGARDVDTFTAPFLNKEKDIIQEELKGYGKLRGQLKYIVTKGVASYVPLTDKIVDLDIPNNLFDATLTLFRRYGIPTAYGQRETRYKSLPEARKELYSGTIIPEGTQRYNAELKMIGIPERDWFYQPDWSHLDFFQESLFQSGQALYNASMALSKAVEGGFLSANDAKGEFEYYLNR